MLREIKSQTRVLILNVLSFACIHVDASAPLGDSERLNSQDATLGQWLKEWPTKEILLAPKNIFALEQLKKLSSPSARILLLRAGDPQTIEFYLKEFRRVERREMAVIDIIASANLELIRLLGEYLPSDEPTEYVKVGPEGRPVVVTSKGAALAIQGIVIKSPEFSDAVREWAKQLGYGAVRAQMQAWWKLNRQALIRGNYKAVVPLGELNVETNRLQVPQSTPLLKLSSAPVISSANPAPVKVATPARPKKDVHTRTTDAKQLTWLLASGVAGVIVIFVFYARHRHRK
jgi:hypothetical protein